MIDLKPMSDAVRRLSEATHTFEELQGRVSEPARILLRAGLIQTFEYNYGLAVSTLTRYLISTVADPAKRDLNVFEELIRVADEAGLLLSPFATWKTFRQARNNTSHTYNEMKAVAVADVIPAFEKEVKYLLARLQDKVCS
jgi:nucleotidyltransferase substrate binding protein (TIGR01987 family)